MKNLVDRALFQPRSFPDPLNVETNSFAGAPPTDALATTQAAASQGASDRPTRSKPPTELWFDQLPNWRAPEPVRPKART